MEFFDERAQLKQDEGQRLEVYLDHLGNPTVGFGHLITANENLKQGDKITLARAEQMFEKEYQQAVKEALSFGYSNGAVNAILTNMCYQMGKGGVTKFRKMHQALQSGDFGQAATQMLDSLWARQTPNRANRLANRMRSL